jgi:hypothetical protein
MLWTTGGVYSLLTLPTITTMRTAIISSIPSPVGMGAFTFHTALKVTSIGTTTRLTAATQGRFAGTTTRSAM